MSSRKAILSPTQKIPARAIRRFRKENELTTKDSLIVEIGGEGEDFVLNLLKSVPPTYNHFREGKYLHVSDLVGKCIRKIALVDKFKVNHAASILSDSREITYEIGHCVADYIVRKSMKGHPGKVWGYWVCSRCGTPGSTTPMVFADVKRKCDVCLGEVNKYKEFSIQNEEYLLSGSMDLLFWITEYNSLYITELKSIANDGWKELIRPDPNHIIQAVFYWWLMHRAGYSLIDQISIVYVNKGFMFKLPYKEFIIKPREMFPRLEDYLLDAKARKISLEGGGLPPRVMCANAEVPTAKACEMANLCFSEK